MSGEPRPESDLERSRSEILGRRERPQKWLAAHGLGIGSLALGVFSGVAFFFLLVVAGLMGNSGSDRHENSGFLTLLGFAIIGVAGLVVLGGVLGLVGAMASRSHKVMAVVGLCVNALVFFAILGIMCLGLLAG